MLKLSTLLNIYKSTEVDDFIKKISKYDLSERGLEVNDISKNWKFLGDNESNGSTINMLKFGEKGLVERITNAIDAVIEKQFKSLNLSSAKLPQDVIKKAFPKYFKAYEQAKNGKSNGMYVHDAENQVILSINDSTRSTKPTFDIIDKGTGIVGSDFKDTILSIAKGNKLSSNKSYLIGAFGQGGSTSLPFAYATIIISKINRKFYFTIIKPVELKNYKNIAYVYLTDNNGQILELENDKELTNYQWLNNFSQNLDETGTFIRMVETEISQEYRNNEITKPGMLWDYINTQLFDVGLPVRVIENRKDYEQNANKQNRNAYGSFCKLQTSNYVKNEYSGFLNLEHKNTCYKIQYYVILPNQEEDWGADSKCQRVFEQFNVSDDPIIYTINGQMVSSERFTKLNNAGLSFLKYRLLVVVNLDVLGTDKYRFVTSDRAQIKNIDLTVGFLDKVVQKLAEEEKLQEINSIISEKSISSSIDKDVLKDIAKQVKKDFSKYLKSTAKATSGRGKGKHNTSLPEEIFLDHIESIEIDSPRETFYKDQDIYVILKTGAQRHINNEAQIDMYIDGKNFTVDITKNIMNGRISYIVNGGMIKPGKHTMNFVYYQQTYKTIESNTFNFTVLDEKSPDIIPKELKKDLDFDIQILNSSSLICNVSKDEVNKKICVYICWNIEILEKQVFNNMPSSDDIAEFKKSIIKPMALFALFMKDNYDKLDDEQKNILMLNYIKSLAGEKK